MRKEMLRLFFGLLGSAWVAGCSESIATNNDLSMTGGDAAPVDMAVDQFPASLTLAATTTQASCLAVDATAVYFIDDSVPSLIRVPLDGSAQTTLAQGGDLRGCVRVDLQNAYFSSSGAIVRVALATGAVTVLATSQHLLTPLYLQGGALYFITDVYGDIDAYNGKNAIVRLAIDGGSIDVVDNSVVGQPGGLAVDASNFYFSDRNGMVAHARNGMGSVTFGSSVLHANSFALGENGNNHLAMVELAGIGIGDVALFSLDGSGRTVLSGKLASSLFLDADALYAGQSGSLVRYALDGTSTTPYAALAPRAIVADAGYVYFTDGQALRRITK